MNYKNERIWKLHLRGMVPAQIARKTGYSLERVMQGIVWMRDVEKRTEPSTCPINP